MKSYFLISLLTLSTTVLLAQDQVPRPTSTNGIKTPRAAQAYEVPQEDLDALKEKLKLSEEQAQKWAEVSANYQPRFEELATVDSLDERAKIGAGRKIQREKEAELKQFIFAAQWDVYLAMKRKKRRTGLNQSKGLIKREKQPKKGVKEKEGDG